MPKPIYLDYNATTPHDPEVIAAMRPFLEEEFGNPSSSHYYGNKPRQAVVEAREQVPAAVPSPTIMPSKVLLMPMGIKATTLSPAGSSIRPFWKSVVILKKRG
jgi:cysteine desulfurase